MERNAAAGTRATDAPPAHKLHGRCPDLEPCRFPQSPCSQHCSRLQATEITAELQAQVLLAKQSVRGYRGRPDRRKP